jgi:hypothetical protein
VLLGPSCDSLFLLCVSVQRRLMFRGPGRCYYLCVTQSYAMYKHDQTGVSQKYASLCICLVELSTTICCYPFDFPIDCQQSQNDTLLSITTHKPYYDWMHSLQLIESALCGSAQIRPPLPQKRRRGGPPNAQNTKICCGVFQTVFHSPNRRQHSGPLLWDLLYGNQTMKWRNT